MASIEQLSIGSIVWAKVEPYPWWPGTIVKTITQQRKNIYKVAFFADPTYTFLTQAQLLPFDNHHPNTNELIHTHPGLLQAVSQAKTHQSNHLQLPNITSEPLVADPSNILTFPSNTSQFREQKSTISSLKTVESNLPSIKQPQAMQSQQSQQQISTDNVIHLLQNLSSGHRKQEYCYQKRKELVQYKNKLKQHLLKRYNLLNIVPIPQKVNNIDNNDSSSVQLIQKKVVRTSNKSKKINKSSRSNISHHNIESLTNLCIRKLYTLLKNNQDSIQQTREQAMDMIRRLVCLSEDNSCKFKSLFVTLVKTIAKVSQNSSCDEQLCGFRNYLERLEGEKDQEGSRITQIENNLN